MKNTKLIQRDLYLNRLRAWKDNFEIIKVITGIRRCGKSKLLESFANELINSGVKKEAIIQINFEDMKYDNISAIELYQELEKKIQKNKNSPTYIFLDEIQKVPSWEKVIASLRLKENIDIYITGSNAYLLSSELATYLSGRYIEIHIYPLSFKEFLSFYTFDANWSLEKKFLQYMKFGGLPSLSLCDFNEQKVSEIFDAIYNTVLVKDILTHTEKKDVNILNRLILFLADNISNRCSINSITNSLYAQKYIQNKNNNLIEEYLSSIKKSFIFYTAQRYDIKGKEILKSLEKYYMVDSGLRFFTLGKLSDTGRLLENIVYFELLRRGYKVYIGKSEDKEIDFIVLKNDEKIYFQVSESISDPLTRKREIDALESINDNLPKVILTTDILQTGITDTGIKIESLIDWLVAY